MLSRKGKFIREKKPVIGRAYVPYKTISCSHEEQFMQDILLGAEQQKRSFLSWFFGKMLRV